MPTQEELKVRVRNDFAYHPATNETGPLHNDIREVFTRFAMVVIDLTPVSREQSLALTALQEALMWSNAAVAVNLAPAQVP